MAITYKELIEVAIASPESGHVNFYAMQVLLTCFAQHLKVLDQVIVQDDYMMRNERFETSLMTSGKSRMPRMLAGADAEAVEVALADLATKVQEEDAAPIADTEEVPLVDQAKETPPAAETPPPSLAEETPPLPPAEETPPLPPAEETPPLPPAEGFKAEVAPKLDLERTSALDAMADDKSLGIPTVPSAVSRSSTRDKHGAQAPKLAPERLSSLDAMADDKSLGIPTVLSAVSRSSTRDKHGSAQSSLLSSIMRLETRVSYLELLKENADMENHKFSTNLTAQLMIIFKQLDTVSHILIDSRLDHERMKVLRHNAKELRLVMKAPEEELSIGSFSDDIDGCEGELDEFEEELPEESSATTIIEEVEEEQVLEMDVKKIFYSPNRMVQNLLEVDAQICTVTNKVNDLSNAFLMQDTQKLLAMITELQDRMREVRVYISDSKESSDDLKNTVNALQKQINLLNKTAAHLEGAKSERTEIELLLAEKPNFQQLATKVSLEQLEDYKERLDIKFCEIQKLMGLNERNVLEIIDNLHSSMGIDAMQLGLKDFREMIERKVHGIADALQKYMEMIEDDSAAAAGRVKVIQDLTCLSCNTNCVMLSKERSKLPKLPVAEASTGLGPLITYELGQIRESGVMGYYRKDEFPHSTSAFAKAISGVPVTKCTRRQAGGPHTIYTAEEHLQKVVLSKKNALLT